MNILQEAERLLASMSTVEKATLLRRVIDLTGGGTSGIEATAGVCGGEPRVAGTRITVRTLEQARRAGASDADLLRAYPALTAGDLSRVRAYAAAHPTEIDHMIREDEAA